MSHFAVSCVTSTPDASELEALLQPYHEFECTGVDDQYVVFVDEHEKVFEEWNTKTWRAYRGPDGTVFQGNEDIFYREPTAEELNTNSMMGSCGFGGGISYCRKDWGDGKGYRPKVHEVPAGFAEFEQPAQERFESIEAFAKDWHGYEAVKGRIGHYTNPNYKWDWWEIGGRWSDYLLLKDGTSADQAIKSDIDFVGKQDRKVAENASLYDRIAVIVDGRTWKTWDQARDEFEKIDQAREFYNNQPVVVDLRKHDVWIEPDRYAISRASFLERARLEAISTFAVLDHTGWHERGSMGWWGIVSGEKEDWLTKYHRMLQAIPDDKFITIVDCHI